MKILLIYPPPIEKRVYYEEDIQAPPIGIYYVAAVLKENGHDVKIVSWQGEKDIKDMEAILEEEKPDIVGFSILNANRWSGIEIAQMIKKINPQISVVFGGPGATFLYEHLLKNFGVIDYIVMGEGEYTFMELARFIENEGKDPVYIRGIAYRQDGKIIRTKDREFISDLDALPIPAKYFTYRHVCSSRGCPWNCLFCGSPKFWRRRLRVRSPKNFVDEIELLYKKGVNFFYFSDDNLTIRKDRIIEICKEIIKRGLDISWYAISRVSYVDDDILYWMRMAGCIQISYGVESGSEKIRQILNKPLKRDEIENAFHLTRSYGILPRAYFIYGSPGEDWDAINETIELIHTIKPLSCLFYILDIFPGTELYERVKRVLNIDENIWLNKIEGIMYWELDPNLSKDLILEFGRSLRTEFYRALPSFVSSISLIEKPELYERHADFCSRLAMTFSHGDYSNIDLIPDKELVAERLYRMALMYAPEHRAYLGLGIILQRMQRFEESIELLKEGIKYFPDSEQLHICLGISYMNVSKIKEAIACFEKFPDSPQAREYLIECKNIIHQI